MSAPLQAFQACKCCGKRDATVCIYNDFDDQPGDPICDACIYAAADPGPVVVILPTRPEGYYHLPIGGFDE